jgi:hypothetical protein
MFAKVAKYSYFIIIIYRVLVLEVAPLVLNFPCDEYQTLYYLIAKDQACQYMLKKSNNLKIFSYKYLPCFGTGGLVICVEFSLFGVKDVLLLE